MVAMPWKVNCHGSIQKFSIEVETLNLERRTKIGNMIFEVLTRHLCWFCSVEKTTTTCYGCQTARCIA